jgi:hypothetical protein
MRKSSDKVPASRSLGSATRHWGVCSSGGKTQSLDRLTSQTKSIWSVFHIFLMSRTKDMRPTMQLKKWVFRWMDRLRWAYCMLFDIFIWIHIASLLKIFHSVILPSRKTKTIACEKFGGAMSYKSAVLSTPMAKLHKKIDNDMSYNILLDHHLAFW